MSKLSETPCTHNVDNLDGYGFQTHQVARHESLGWN